MALIAPSITAADWAKFGEALEVMQSAGAAMVHVDVMDGHFVPDISIGQPVLKGLRKATELVLDVHLLIERPERYIGEFIEAGADRISVHPESTRNFRQAVQAIRSRGAKAGLTLNPSTPLETLSEVWPEIDLLTIMTAEPGLCEGSFIPSSIEKVRAATLIRAERRLSFDVQAEGGIGPGNMEALARAGADILIAGSAIFNNGDPRARLLQMIRNAARIPATSRV
jgi:ribulose-phosphate 3-epimerase